MDCFKEIIKKNKKRALAIAVATAFSVSGPSVLLGCNTQKVEEEEEEDNTTSTGTYHSSIGRVWHSFNNASDNNGKSIKKASSSNSSGTSVSSGYSGVKGGSASS
ncbi:MAG: hypothetical protein E7207_05245 [Clostridium butyricum]|nr:hypothetical protein [Clostridium butyricum]